MFKFSEHGIKNKDVFCTVYKDFISWCKKQLSGGTFSTYCDGEPVCFCCGIELSYRDYVYSTKNDKKSVLPNE